MVLVLTATATVSGSVSQLVVDANWLTRTLKTIDRFLWLVDYAEEVRRPTGEPEPVPKRITEGFRFENVSFTYPGTDAVVLSDVDLFLPAGGTVAIVGDNGAGKATLVKLLCRFYETTSGGSRSTASMCGASTTRSGDLGSPPGSGTGDCP